jgi:hypothetical protein
MKTKSIFIAVVLTAGIVVSVVANDNNKSLAILRANGTEVYKIIYKGESSKTVKINVYDYNADLVFTETINGSNGFILPLNFKGLASGEYTIELTDAAGKHAEKINYQPLTVKAEDETSVHVSRVAKNSDKFVLSMTTKSSDEVTINIYDENDQLIFNETKQVNGGFAQVYSIKNVNTMNGAVTFQVVSGNKNIKTMSFN